MGEAVGTAFLDALDAETRSILDACTRCGACVEACPMVEPAGLGRADPVGVAVGIADLLAGGDGTPEAVRWASVCSNSGKCIPACDYGVNPRLMVNLARAAARRRAGNEAPRRQGREAFTTMSRGVRVLSRMQLPPDVLARVNPPVRTADEYESAPDVVFYTGCNVLKTPHIALIALDVLDALGVRWEVVGGPAACCGVLQFRQGDARTSGRVGFNTIERLSRPSAERVLSWCPSCQIQIGEVALPAYAKDAGEAPFALDPFIAFLGERLDDLKPLFVHRVERRVAIAERPGLPHAITAIKRILRAIPGLDLVDLDVPYAGSMLSGLASLPEFKRTLVEGELAAAAEAGVDTFATVFHACHREMVRLQPGRSFEIVNAMELIGEAMGIRHEDLFKRLALMADVDAVVADTADTIAAHGLGLDEARAVIARELFPAAS